MAVIAANGRKAKRILYLTLPRLEALRAEQTLTQGELAQLAQITRVTVYHAEAGHRVHLATARKLALALHVELAALRVPVEEEPDGVAV